MCNSNRHSIVPPFKIVLVDDDVVQLKTIERKISVALINIGVSIQISKFQSSNEFLLDTDSYDFYVFDYEMGIECNGVELVRKKQLFGNGVVFSGNIGKITPNEVTFVNSVRYQLVEKPDCKKVGEIIQHAIYNFSPNTNKS